MDHDMAAAIDRIITLKTNRRLQWSWSSEQASAKQLASIFLHNIHKESSDKCVFPMMTNVCSTSEYRTIINFNTRFDPNVFSVNMLWCQYVSSLMSQLGIQKGGKNMHIQKSPLALHEVWNFFKKFFLFICLVGMEIYKSIIL